MSTDNRIRIELTTDRKPDLGETPRSSAADFELSAEELEPRIAPSELPTESLSFSYGAVEVSYWTR